MANRLIKRFLAKRLLTGCVAVIWATGITSGAAVAASGDDKIALNSLSGVYLAARSADANRDFKSAASFYRAAFKNDPDNLSLLDRTLVLTVAEGRVGDALPFADQLAKKVPNNHAAKMLQAVTSLRGKKYGKAIAQYDKAGSSILNDLSKALLISWAEFGRGEVDKAIALLDATDAQPWYSVYTDLHSGYILAAAGRFADAVPRFEAAYKQNRNSVLLADAYARALHQTGKPEAARKIVSEYTQRFPDNPLIRLTAADMDAGRPVPANVRTAQAGVAAALSDLGLIIGREGSLENSAFFYRLSLYLETQLAGGLSAMSYGNVLEANNRNEEAIEVYNLVGAKAAYRNAALLRAAISLNRLDKVDEAEAAFKEALQDGERSRDQVLVAYGNMLRGRERYGEASRLYSQAIDLLTGEPARQDWTLYYSRGITYERTKQWPKAEQDFKKALEVYPDQPLVLNYLGYSWVDMGIQLEPALDMIRKAVELRPNDGYIVDSLGWAYYRLGRYEEAVKELERAVSLRASDPIINDHLGDAYWKVGRFLEAQFQWRHARDLGAEKDELERINEKIRLQTLIEDEKAPVEEKRGSLSHKPVMRAAVSPESRSSPL